MATYTIELNDTDAEHIETIRARAGGLERHGVEFAGTTIEVEHGDFTCVNGPDELAGAQLLAIVHGILADARGENEEA